jgi:hypothetical protein
MRRHPGAQAPRTHARQAAEVYCRRDNRVYPTCPYVQAGSACPCLQEVETADALFDPSATDIEPDVTGG